MIFAPQCGQQSAVTFILRGLKFPEPHSQRLPPHNGHGTAFRQYATVIHQVITTYTPIDSKKTNKGRGLGTTIGTASAMSRLFSSSVRMCGGSRAGICSFRPAINLVYLPNSFHSSVSLAILPLASKYRTW